ncbi:VOC family protein [Georgenia thermotolerans]|uniref:Glyoxalase n=1 Tax=Georgenia thermotolerans TaxID=527326 RepID=A0A7J5UIZ2_9MICO|nr:VOC family protein [Georgenia thermotolerans]KAE8762342.1 glyoxalase [Georgenia thermotolerans]
MDQRLSFITLAVPDPAASRRFYADGLGWEPAFEAEGEVVFFLVAPTVVLSLWRADDFAAEVGPLDRRPGTAPLTLAHNVPTPAQVDAVLAEAVAAGGTLVGAAQDREWGGRSGYFADPDGYRWEVAYNPGPIGEQLMRAAGLLGEAPPA